MYTNPMHDIFKPGTDITATTSAPITGKTFVKISGPMQRNLLQVATANAGDMICGVAKYDASNGSLVGIARGASRIVTVTAASDITPGVEVQVGTNGQATPKTDGHAVGYAVDAAKANSDALISLYH